MHGGFGGSGGFVPTQHACMAARSLRLQLVIGCNVQGVTRNRPTKPTKPTNCRSQRSRRHREKEVTAIGDCGVAGGRYTPTCSTFQEDRQT